MFRKHFRFRRLVLGLAFAAIAAPVAQAGTQPSYLRYHEVGYPVAAGPQAKAQRTTTALQADGLRWQAIAAAYHSRQATITPLQADGLRWQAIADAYRSQQATAAISERSNGVPGPDPSLVPVQVVSATSSSFDWQDAGIGASTAFGVALLLVIAVAIIRRNQHTGLTSA